MYYTITDMINLAISNGAESAMTLEQIILNEIREWDNSRQKADMIDGWRYYKNEKSKELTNGFIRKLSKQKTDYLLSKPFSILTKNETYLKLLNEIFDDNFRRTLKNAGVQAINKGIAWLQLYFENSRPAFKLLSSEEVIPLWLDEEHKKLHSVIRTYILEEYSGITKKHVRHVEFWNENGVRRYILEGSGLTKDVEKGESESYLKITKGDDTKENNWNKIPFIAFKYNSDELPLLKGLKGAIDDYDNQKSVISKLLREIPNFIYVLKNYGGADLDEFIKDLAEKRVIKIDEEGGADKLQADINITAYDTYMQQARKDIYEFGRGVDTQAVDLGNASGQALKFRYADLDTDCNEMETEFSASMQELLWFVNQYLKLTGKGDFTNEKVEFVFNRDIIINETETIQQCVNSKDVVSDETIISNHPWTADVSEELKRLEKQRNENAKMQQRQFGIQNNTPPDGAGE